MSLESFPKKEDPFDRLKKDKEAQGWIIAGHESLTHTKFRSEDARFVEVPLQTEEEIIEKYLQMAKSQDPDSEFEIELVLDENTDTLRRFREMESKEEYNKILENLRDKNKSFIVYIRKK